MRVLLDECLPRRLGLEFGLHEVTTVSQAGWSGVKNGELLRLAASQYDAFVTVDKLLANEQLVPAELAVVTVRATSNRLETLMLLVPDILHALTSIQAGEIIEVGV